MALEFAAATEEEELELWLASLGATPQSQRLGSAHFEQELIQTDGRLDKRTFFSH